MADPYYQDEQVTVHHGDCLDVLAELPDASVDSVCTDPPYGLDFMGKHWDTGAVAFDTVVWGHCLRALKPGGHLLAFGGTRTWHRLACAIEDAGFEIRDSIAWLYGSGFPKSLDVSKAIDKAADAAKQWQGWGTALKPAFEPIAVARKPFKGTVAANVVEHGTGALNIDATRVGSGGQLKWSTPRDMGYHGGSDSAGEPTTNALGRWPANVALDSEMADELDRQSGVSRDGVAVNRNKQAGEWSRNTVYGSRNNNIAPDVTYGGEGGASRFFPTFRYTAKAPGTERPTVDGIAHPTVKPLELMRWLVRLVTPPHGLVLDPFAGSGTTAEACIHEHMRCITIEREADYLPLIMARLSKPMKVGFDFEEDA